MRVHGDAGFKAKLDPKNIEAIWADHEQGCARCRLVELESPATLVHCCPEGAQYLKVIFEKMRAPAIASARKADRKAARRARGETYTSKAKALALTRYK